MDTILRINFSKDFGKLYEEYKAQFHFEEIDDISENSSPAIGQSKDKPHTLIEKDNGYLILGGEKIQVGGCRTNKFRLLEALCTPFGTAKTMDAIFEQMNTNGRDETSADAYRGRSEKESAIKGTFKEVQRVISAHKKKVKNIPKLKLESDSLKVWLSVIN